MSDDVAFDPFSHDTYDAHRHNWTRWLPEPIQETPPAQAEPPSVKSPDPGVRLKNSLARLRKQAHDQGYNEGRAAGHADGLAKGLADGHQQGHQDGYRAGYEAGHEEGKVHAEQAARDLAALAQQSATSLAEIEASIGQSLITLAVRIAEQVLHRTLETDPRALLAVVDDILRLDTGNTGVLRLYVNPEDLALVHDYLHDNPDTSMWRVLPDDAITRGGCKARTALGDIDATLEKRWQRVISTIGGDI